jgi:signal transduction histidine kinase/ligand-binding sensor domain-containing protein
MLIRIYTFFITAFCRKMPAFGPILFIFISNVSYCQGEKASVSLFVTSYVIEDGLRQSMVRQVCQDNRGLIWMVTGDGLQCFDGQEFRDFRVNSNSQNSYSENIMREIAQYKPGEFIISTTSSILYFNTATGNFKTVLRKSGLYPRVFDLKFQNKTLVWLPASGFYLADEYLLKHIKLNYADGQQLPISFAPGLAVESRYGSILVESEKGYLEIKKENQGSDSVLFAKWVSLQAGCQGIAKDSKGNVYIVSGNKIYIYENSGLIREFSHFKIPQSNYLFVDSQRNFWISDKVKKKIYRFNGFDLQEIKLYAREGKNTDSLNPSIINIYEDKANNLWFGTDGNGVLLYSPRQTQFKKARCGFTRCLAYSRGEIWAGTYKNGLWRLSLDLTKAARVNAGQLGNELYFLDMAIDHNGSIWLATDKGLYVTDADEKIIYEKPFQLKSASFVYVSGDSLLLSGDNYLYTFAIGHKPSFVKVKEYPFVRKNIRLHDKNWFESPFGLYISTVNSGFSNQSQFADKNRVSAKPVYCMTLIDDNIWAATESGIDRYNSSGEIMPDMSFSHELYNEIIYSVLSDTLHRVWFTSNKGIGCIPAERDRIVWFNERNNLQSLEFNYNASLKTPEGFLYFGGINGVNCINPFDFEPGKRAPVVQLISLYLSDKLYTAGIPPQYLDAELSWKSPNLSGKVFTTDYQNPEMQLYSFYLEGYQPTWGNPSPNATFTYRNLPPGKYRLLVKCTDADRNQSEAKCLLTLTIKPPFWQTWWFILFVILLIIFVTVIIAREVQRVRYRNKLHEMERLNAVDKERLRISKDMHDEVGASLTRISILSQLAKNQTNDQEKSAKLVSQINEIAGNVVDEMSEIIWAMNPKNDSLDSFGSYLRQYASSYLESAGIDGIFHFPENIPPVQMSSELRRNIFLTSKEALHNVVKHANATRVEVKFTYEKNLLFLIIQDNGCGFEQEQPARMGNGLTNMRKRIEDMGGQYEIFSQTGKGSEIRLSVNIQLR